MNVRMKQMHNHQAIIDKMGKLREMVLFKIANYKSHPDYIWSDRMLTDVKDSGLVPNREEFIMANLIWKKYNGGVKRDDEGMWELIEYHIISGMKISAIKLLRRFTECNLKDAKEAIDARQIKIEKGW